MTVSEKDALNLLTKYNADRFHLRHALTVKEVMAHFARALGYGDEADFWAVVGLLHDVDYEQFPEAHCKRRWNFWRKSTHRRRSPAPL